MPTKEEFYNALEIVGNAVPVVKSIIQDSTYVLKSEREGDFLQVTKIVQLYSIFKKGKELKGRNLQALSFYLQEGYDKELKEKMAKQLGIKINNVNQINTALRKDGYLIQDKFNKRNNIVDPELQKFKNLTVDKGYKNLVIQFI